MVINDVQFNATLSDIIEELQSQLRLNDIPLLQKTREIPKDIMVQCPYHGSGQEHRPSAGIRKSDGQFHCFACNEVHTLPELISYCFGHTEDVMGTFGWQWLTKNFACVEVETRKPLTLSFVRSTIERLRQEMEIPEKFVTEQELDSYRYTHPYWKKRGITDENIIELFDLGYDKQTDCITFPVRDEYGRCLFVARRSTKTKYFNYPAGSEKPLYGLYEYLKDVQTSIARIRTQRSGKSYFLKCASEVIVCESMLDALTAWQWGKYAVALNGLGNELQFKQLRQLPCRKLILATDNDEAGMKARARIRKNVTNKIITEYQFPDGVKDLNDLCFEGFERLQEVF